MLDIIPILSSVEPLLSRCTYRQLCRILVAILSMSGRVTQLGISRFAGKGGSYRTVHRFFHTPIDWLALNCSLLERFFYREEGVYLLAGDETVVGKSGKKTYGLDRFFTSLASRAVAGVACFSIAAIDVEKRRAYSLSNEQVVRSAEEKAQALARKQKKRTYKKRGEKTSPGPGRPKGSKNKDKSEVPLSAELSRILAQGKKVLEKLGGRVKFSHFVLDGHFGNRYACRMVKQLGLEIITKMRPDAKLFLEPSAEEKRKCSRKKYGARVDYQNLPEGCLKKSESKDGMLTQRYELRCVHEEFGHLLNVVILVRTHTASGQVGHVVLFSSDLSLSGEKLLDYYTLRFQIEFTFRDAKQYFGLEDFMGVSQVAVANGIGVAFFVGNVVNTLLEEQRKDRPGAAVGEVKCYYRGRFYLENLLKMLPDRPDPIICQNLLERITEIGCVHSRTKQDHQRQKAA